MEVFDDGLVRNGGGFVEDSVAFGVGNGSGMSDGCRLFPFDIFDVEGGVRVAVDGVAEVYGRGEGIEDYRIAVDRVRHVIPPCVL